MFFKSLFLFLLHRLPTRSTLTATLFPYTTLFRSVAVPRADIIAIEESASFDGLVALFAEAGHSRIPVYRGSLDTIVGMIHIRDAFAILDRKSTRLNSSH